MKIFGLLDGFSGIRPARSAAFQSCRVADFQIGESCILPVAAGLEARDTADLEVCATSQALCYGWFSTGKYEMPTRSVEYLPHGMAGIVVKK
jgi:hypothetical protein